MFGFTEGGKHVMPALFEPVTSEVIGKCTTLIPKTKIKGQPFSLYSAEMSGFGSDRSSSEFLLSSQVNHKSENKSKGEEEADSEEGELPFASEYSKPLALSHLTEDTTLKDKSDTGTVLSVSTFHLG